MQNVNLFERFQLQLLLCSIKFVLLLALLLTPKTPWALLGASDPLRHLTFTTVHLLLSTKLEVLIAVVF